MVRAGVNDAGVWRARARILAPTAPLVAMESAIRAYAIDGRLDQARSLRYLRDRVPEGTFERLVDELVADTGQHSAIAAVWGHNVADEHVEVARIYESHLRQIAQLCRRAGTRLVLMNYPNRDPFSEVTRRIAREDGNGFVDLQAAFGEILRREPGAVLFVGDGHCNDAGYLRMAELSRRTRCSASRRRSRRFDRLDSDPDGGQTREQAGLSPRGDRQRPSAWRAMYCTHGSESLRSASSRPRTSGSPALGSDSAQHADARTRALWSDSSATRTARISGVCGVTRPSAQAVVDRIAGVR